jgi:hypothetical protein
MVVVEVAATLVLLVRAGLTNRSFLTCIASTWAAFTTSIPSAWNWHAAD